MSGRAWFPTSAGLLTWQHYERVGPAWMVFLWMIHEQRKPEDGEEDTGAVRNREVISYRQIGKALCGMPERTVRRHITLLEHAGYIRCERAAHGNRFWITNSIRWQLTPGRSHRPEVADHGRGGWPEVANQSGQKWPGRVARSGRCNKEGRTKNLQEQEQAPPFEVQDPSPKGQTEKLICPCCGNAGSRQFSKNLCARCVSRWPHCHPKPQAKSASA